jgi:hypothetical protein
MDSGWRSVIRGDSDIDNLDLTAFQVGQHIDCRSAASKVPHHFLGHRLRECRHAACRDTMVGREHKNVTARLRRHNGPQAGREPTGKILETAQ